MVDTDHHAALDGRDALLVPGILVLYQTDPHRVGMVPEHALQRQARSRRRSTQERRSIDAFRDLPPSAPLPLARRICGCPASSRCPNGAGQVPDHASYMMPRSARLQQAKIRMFLRNSVAFPHHQQQLPDRRTRPPPRSPRTRACRFHPQGRHRASPFRRCERPIPIQTQVLER